MDKFTLKADKLFAKSFLEQKYPNFTHMEKLDSYFDYYAGLLSQFINGNINLHNSIENLSPEVIKIFENYVNDSKEKDEILIYYLMLKTSVLILKRHYNIDGIKKY